MNILKVNKYYFKKVYIKYIHIYFIKYNLQPILN